jgi:hypothetical protein
MFGNLLKIDRETAGHHTECSEAYAERCDRLSDLLGHDNWPGGGGAHVSVEERWLAAHLDRDRAPTDALAPCPCRFAGLYQ